MDPRFTTMKPGFAANIYTRAHKGVVLVKAHAVAVTEVSMSLRKAAIPAPASTTLSWQKTHGVS